MRIACISASNTKSKGNNSTSTKVCHMIRDILLQESKEAVKVDVIALMDYELRPCILCGGCMVSGRCEYDKKFNKLAELLEQADALFIVIPHYSPIPSKLIMLFEKLNEIMYSGWLHNPELPSRLTNKPVGLIGHGGMAENETTLRYYQNHLLKPVADVLRSLSFKVVKIYDSQDDGVTFGLKDDTCIRAVENEIFPEIIQDWPRIEERIKPLVDKVYYEYCS